MSGTDQRQSGTRLWAGRPGRVARRVRGSCCRQSVNIGGRRGRGKHVNPPKETAPWWVEVGGRRRRRGCSSSGRLPPPFEMGDDRAPASAPWPTGPCQAAQAAAPATPPPPASAALPRGHAGKALQPRRGGGGGAGPEAQRRGRGAAVTHPFGSLNWERQLAAAAPARDRHWGLAAVGGVGGEGVGRGGRAAGEQQTANRAGGTGSGQQVGRRDVPPRLWIGWGGGERQGGGRREGARRRRCLWRIGVGQTAGPWLA